MKNDSTMMSLTRTSKKTAITNLSFERRCLVPSMIDSHAKGYNSHSLGVCYEGGYDEHGNVADTRTAKQKASLLALLKKLKAKHPQAKIVGHRDLPNVKKDCPCFDCSEYADL